MDWARLLPTVTLYVHLTDHTLATGHGVARWEGEGPVSAQYVRDFLGPTSRFTIKPVIDLAGQAAVDAYEVPDRLREAVHLRTPADVFPYASNTSRRMDLDHTRPYRHTASAGQTGMDNLGPLGRFHHRVRTHGNWAVEQPFPGIYLWRAPHGRSTWSTTPAPARSPTPGPSRPPARTTTPTARETPPKTASPRSPRSRPTSP
ncbi:hypothetical protein K1X13_14870 [Nocardioides sp. WL0053]|uniref:Uncharacterized protein n=1 Tax=Nocardioides jiangsuensis TaxID=2866161 RepID=A0ABS7RM97_9ACTN|nr:hypothetical protein [Nocardioides jiangsuensis]MBY9076116.1 hypothetical protein [Nocardioides jiangsuensis]